MSTERIVFNGKEYSSAEEMPPAEREIYEQLMGSVFADKDRDGVPDIFKKGTVEKEIEISSEKISDLDDLPPEVRKLVEGAPGAVTTGELVIESSTPITETEVEFTVPVDGKVGKFSSITVDGKAYSSVEGMPPEVRNVYERLSGGVERPASTELPVGQPAREESAPIIAGGWRGREGGYDRGAHSRGSKALLIAGLLLLLSAALIAVAWMLSGAS